MDKSLPDNSRRGTFKKIIIHSLSHISAYGFNNYLQSVKDKIQKKELYIVSIEVPHLDENKILEQVNKRKNKRLKIEQNIHEPIIKHEFKSKQKPIISSKKN